ncbi:MAG TPA: DUF2079 domain-containing protein, partial [Phycisphaerae bacterium]
MALLTVANLAALLHVLYVARVDTVRYELRWPGDQAGGPFGGFALFLAVAIALGAAVWARGHLGKNKLHWSRVVIAAWPAALPVVWIAYALDPRAGFLMVLAAIVASGWGGARFVDAVLRYRENPAASAAISAVDVTAAEQHAPVARWWQEPAFWAVVGLTGVLAVFHTWVQIQMHRMLEYGSPDIGYYTEMLLNVLRGRGLRSEAFGHHFFGEHFSPGLYLLVPFFAACPRIEFLMALGAIAVLSGAWAIYALTRVSSGSSAAATLLALAYLLYPSNSRVIYGASYGFHEILLALPLMLWSFYVYTRQRWLCFLLFALLALSFKEDVAIVYAMFGLYVAVFSRRWCGLLLGAGCVLYFVVTIRWIVPAFNEQGTYSKYYLYAGLGGTPGGIVAHFFQNPTLLLGRLFTWRPLGYAMTLTAPLALAPLRRPVVLAALPTFIFICLMDTPDFASIKFWHQATLLPILWLATLQSIAPCGTRRTIRPGMMTAVLVCTGLTHYALGFSPISRVWRDVPLEHERESALIARLHALIPKSDAVQASARLSAHFI